MATKLTEKVIERLQCPQGKRDALLFDTEQRGLAVRVVAVGSKTYLAQYALAGRKHRVPLGSVSAVSLASARAATAAIMGQVAQGQNPAATRKAVAEKVKLDAQRERMTFSKLVGAWETMHLTSRRPRYREEAVKSLRRVFSETWDRPVDRLARKDVIKVLDRLPPSMGRATAAYGRACFSWGFKREMVETNPFEALAVRTVATKRDRVLTDAECARVWKAASETPAPFGPIVRILMLTGQRREEVGRLAWAELSSDLKTWTIPAERTKNGQPSIVPLSEPVTRLLQERLTSIKYRRAGLVFPGEGGKPFGNWSKLKSALDKAAAVTDWRIHDIRRTVATGLQRLGVRLEVTEAVLNHVSGTRGGIAGVYQRHDWASEKKEALQAWAEHLKASAAQADDAG